MKKTLTVLFATILLAVVLLGAAGCGGQQSSAVSEASQASVQSGAESEAVPEAPQETVTLKVGAVPTPHAEILEQVKDTLAAQGYDLQIVVYNDYILPNTALDQGELDANFFQHLPYLEDFNEKNGTDLVGVGTVHFEPLGIYAGRTGSLAELTEGAEVAVPNDNTNEARALLLLESQGLITLREGVGLEATVQDIEENPLNLSIREIEAAQVPRALPDVDIAVINGNYAMEASLGEEETLAIEDAGSTAAVTYANWVVVRSGDEGAEAVQALVAAIQTEEISAFITDTYGSAVVPLF